MQNPSLVEISQDSKKNFELSQEIVNKDIADYVVKIGELIPDLDPLKKFTIVYGTDQMTQHSIDGNILVYRVSIKLIANMGEKKKVLIETESDQFVFADQAYLNAVFKFYKSLTNYYKQIKYQLVDIKKEIF